MAEPYTVEFSLYLVASTATSKEYVGQTRQPLRKRWNHHRHMAAKNKKGSCSALHEAMRKYGIDTFTCTLIGTYRSQADLNAAEYDTVKVRGTLSPGGYNLKAGGGNGRHSPETIAKMKIAAKARGNNRPGYRHTEETKARMREAAGTGRPKGWAHSAAARAKMSLALRGDNR